MAYLIHKIYINQGDVPGLLIVSNKQAWYVVREVWERHQIVNVMTHGSYATKEEAEKRRAKVQAEYSG